MEELIKVSQNENGTKTVSAKDLYLFLGMDKAHWTRWSTKNIIDNDFAIENQDWGRFTLMVNGNQTQDFVLSIDFAKKLSMMAKTAKGEEARVYFISCETKLIANLPTTYLEALKALVAKEERLLLIEEENKKLQFRSDFVDVCFDTESMFSMEETAKILKLPYGRNTMMEKLKEKKVLTLSNTPTQKFITNGYFKVVEEMVVNGKFRRLISTTYATQKGIGYIYKILNKEIED